MGNIAVLSHNADMDGVGAAAMLKIKYNIPSSRLFFSSYNKEDILYAQRKLKKFYGGNFILFITDLSLNDPTIPVWKKLIRGVKAMGGSVFWFDHHPWSNRAIGEIASLCDVAIVGENKFCATEITKKEIELNTPFAEEFAKVVHYSDFNLRPDTAKRRKYVKTYALSITSYTKSKSNDSIQKSLRHIADVVASRRFVDARMLAASRSFEKKNTARINKMLKKLYLIGSKITIGFAIGVQTTQACGAVIEKSGRDIGIVIDMKQKKGSIRSKRSDISGLAKRLGGGGHPHAAGFEFNTANKELIIDKIRKEASKL
ncbi:MAG: hypothetical protein KGH49_04115 [Candidatus Micrarchaeota archaeon]|nr:hypothetical protein [Candidatus Micrarchaeota archaeon]